MAYSKVQIEGQISFFGEERGETRQAGESSVINFSVAVQQRKKEGDKWVNGETLWKRCEAWGRTAENIAKSFKKGDLVLITGEERADSFEKDGEKVVRDKVRVDSIGPSLRWDTAESHREPSKGGGNYGGDSGGGNRGNSGGGSNSGGGNSGGNKSGGFDDLDFSDFGSGSDGDEPPF